MTLFNVYNKPIEVRDWYQNLVDDGYRPYARDMNQLVMEYMTHHISDPARAYVYVFEAPFPQSRMPASIEFSIKLLCLYLKHIQHLKYMCLYFQHIHHRYRILQLSPPISHFWQNPFPKHVFFQLSEKGLIRLGAFCRTCTLGLRVSIQASITNRMFPEWSRRPQQ
jgi:hypothetical protein